MNELLQSVDELRRMSEAELTQLGQTSLLQRLREQGHEARAKHGPLHPGNLESFLADPDCLRHPVRLLLEYGEMGLHQFAQPERDHRTAGGSILYLRPSLGCRPDLLALAVSYFVPVLNYGEIITDEHCLAYGAALMGLSESAYYARICGVADYVGAEPKPDDPATRISQAPPARHRGGCGCHGPGDLEG